MKNEKTPLCTLPTKKTSKNQKRKILLIDGNNIVAKCTHVTLAIVQKDRHLMKASYQTAALAYSPLISVIKMIRGFIVDNPVDMILFAVDDNVPSFRKRLIPDYKGSRLRAAKEDKKVAMFRKVYKEQLTYAHDVLGPLGIHVVRSIGYEADDTIGACSLIRYRPYKKIIMSEDKDFMQLVNKRCFLYRPSKKIICKERIPGYLIMRAMWGDASDCIKGVPAIGEARSLALVQDHPTDNVYHFLDSLDESIPNEARVLKHEDILLRNLRVTNLCRTARKANERMLITEGKQDYGEFIDVCKRYRMREFLMATQPMFEPFKRINNFWPEDPKTTDC